MSEETLTSSPWKHNPDGSIMGDEDGKAVTEAFFEVQRPVAEKAFSIYSETGSWFQAAITFGCGPEWAQSICKRYGLIA
jgi:hypothetical protein